MNLTRFLILSAEHEGLETTALAIPLHMLAKQIGKKALRFPRPVREDNRFCFAELVLLHDWTGLNYREIIEIPIFCDLQYLSMSRLYQIFSDGREGEIDVFQQVSFYFEPILQRFRGSRNVPRSGSRGNVFGLSRG